MDVPGSVRRLWAWTRTFGFSVEVLPFEFECIGLGGIKNKLIFVVLAPLALMLIILVSVLLLGPMARMLGRARQGVLGQRGSGDGEKQGRLRGVNAQPGLKFALIRAVPVLLWTTLLTYSLVSSVAFSAFDCESFDYDLSFLRADRAVACYDTAGKITPEYGAIQDWAILGMVLYPFGVPFVYLLLLWHAREAITTGAGRTRRGTVAHALRLLWGDYKPNCWYWEVAELARKVVLVGFFALIQPGSTLQLSAAVAFCVCFLMLQLVVQPFKLALDNLVASCTSFALVLIFFFCSLLQQQNLVEATSDRLTADLERKYNFSASAITFGLAISGLVTCGFAGLAVLWEVQKQTGQRRLRRAKDRTVVYANSLKPDRYHAFLSHNWQSGQDQARGIKQLMKELVPGFKVWLDVDDGQFSLKQAKQKQHQKFKPMHVSLPLSHTKAKQVAAAEAGTSAAKGGAESTQTALEAKFRDRISKVDALIAFLGGEIATDGQQSSLYFRSPFCRAEFKAAVEFGIRIVLIHEINPGKGGVAFSVHLQEAIKHFCQASSSDLD